MPTGDEVYLTAHGFKRMRERVKITKRAMANQVARAIERGKTPSDFEGRSYQEVMRRAKLKDQNGNLDLYWYKSHIYVVAFVPESPSPYHLVTVLPVDLRRDIAARELEQSKRINSHEQKRRKFAKRQARADTREDAIRERATSKRVCRLKRFRPDE